MKSNFSKLFYAIFTIVLVGVFSFVSLNPLAAAQNSDNISQIIASEPKAIPVVNFLDTKGRERTLDEFRGKVVIVNFWAMWCYPCKKEMPALDALQKEFGGMGLEIVPLSNDMTGTDGIEKFYADNSITNLGVFIDKGSSAFRMFRLRGIPTSIIIDRRGMEAARVSGFIDWADPAVKDYIKKLLKEPI